MTKVLVIDDIKMMRIYLRRCLERAGYEVEEWVPLSAMEIPEHLPISAPDLIISESQLPGCNGATLARMVRKVVPKVPLLLLTPLRDREMEANLLKLGVRQVLTKPVEAEALVQAVKNALPVPG
jgi:two-component system chemotaxis response regulator CheY